MIHQTPRKKSEKIVDWMVLYQTPGIGVAGFWNLARQCGGPSAVLRLPLETLRARPGVTARQLAGLAEKESLRSHCRRQLEELRQLGGGCLLYDDDGYPEQLREIAEPPPLLFYRGKKEMLRGDCLAVVGSRAMTSYGSRVAYELCRQLAGAGMTIVSGLALGIDSRAHQGALAAAGAAVGVLGCGVDVVYPRQNRRLFEEVGRHGLLLGEYPPGTPPEGFRFPARNRIIAGLSRGVVVVEATRRSGSLITAQLALDEGREVFAVPGQVDSRKSEGTHWLLRQGAILVQSADDILSELQIFSVAGEGRHRAVQEGEVLLDDRAAALLGQLEAYPLARDALLAASGLAVFEFSELLLLLELEGLVEILPGDLIRRLC